MELRRYWAILWPWKWLVLLGIVLGAGSAYFVSSRQEPTYLASTRVMVSEAAGRSWLEYGSLVTDERSARIYAELFTTQGVLKETITRLGVEGTPPTMPTRVAASALEGTQFIVLTIEHRDPLQAAAIANIMVEVVKDQSQALFASRIAEVKSNLLHELERLEQLMEGATPSGATGGEDRTPGEGPAAEDAHLTYYSRSYDELLLGYQELNLAEVQTVSGLIQIEPAIPSLAPFRPKTGTNTLLGAAAGLIVAVALILLVDYLDDTIRSPAEAVKELGLPVLGLIARMGELPDGNPHVLIYPRSPISEAFRLLRSNLDLSSVDHRIRTLLVTSPGPREGKSTVVVNLAVVVAQSGKRVLLIDADLRRPRVHQIMGVTNRSGLTDLFGEPPVSIGQVGRVWQAENLGLITSGGLPPNPAELLASQRMDKILALVSTKADLVILDSPPAGAVVDAAILATKMDAVLLVVEPERTRLGDAQQVLEQLTRAGAKVIGVVFNNVPSSRMGYLYAGYYSSYYEHYTYAYSENGRQRRRRRGRRAKTAEVKMTPSGPSGRWQA